MSPQRVPAPLEWHPAYAHMTWLLDWLNGTGEYAGKPVLFVAKPLPRIAVSSLNDDAVKITLTDSYGMLTKHQFAGPAPYVGRPFGYLWFGAIDNLGRAICADSTIRYNPEAWLNDW